MRISDWSSGLAERKFSGPAPVLVKLQRPPPDIRIFLPGLLACSTTSTRRPRRPAVIAHISPAAPAPITTASNASAIASVRPPGRRHAHAGFDRQRSAFAIELELAVLHHALDRKSTRLNSSH